MDEVGNGECVVQYAVDLRAVSDSENDGSDSWKYAEVPTVADVAQHDVNEVDLTHLCNVRDGEGQDCVENAETVVDSFESRFFEEGAPQEAAHAAGYGSHTPDQRQVLVVHYLVLDEGAVVDGHHQSEVRPCVTTHLPKTITANNIQNMHSRGPSDVRGH